MGYAHIDNLYKNQDILMFKMCYALEKIHGTSAHVSFRDGVLKFFSGGEKHAKFVDLFDEPSLAAKFEELGHDKIVVYGEAYGGKCQGMSETYGKELKFIAFDVKIGDVWLSVPDMDQVCRDLGFDIVDWLKVPTNITALDAQRDRSSVQAVRNGCGVDKKREGVVLRPLIEVTKNNGTRVCAKHKGDDFKETKTPRRLSPEKLAVLEESTAIADEWVTEMRLSHVLDKLGNPDITKMGEIIKAMVEDVEREASGEIVKSKGARKAIGKRAALMFKARLKNSIGSVWQ